MKPANKYRKLPAIVLLAAVTMTQPVMAETTSVPPTPTSAVEAISENLKPFTPYTVTVGTITELINTEVRQAFRVRSDDTNGGEIDLVINDTSVLVDSAGVTDLTNFKAGDRVAAYYVLPEVMTMIYPPQLAFDVIVKTTANDTTDISVGLYDGQLLQTGAPHESQGLAFQTTEQTQIIDSKGAPYMGLLDNKVLVVYTPVQLVPGTAAAAPDKIIVLDFDAEQFYKETPPVPMPGDQTEPTAPSSDSPEPASATEDLTVLRFEIGGTVVDAPQAYRNEQGVIMVPLRALAEGLGYTVHWDGALSEIRLGNAISLRIGQDSYLVGRMTPISLDAAPEIRNDLTFVPMNFFDQVVHAQIRIDGGVFRLTPPDAADATR